SIARSAVVLELQLDHLVELAQPRDDPLEVVPALARHADGVTLDLRLDLGKLVADQLLDALREVLGQSLPEPDVLAHLVAAGRLHGPPVEHLERQAASDGFRLDQVLDGARAELVVGDEDDLVLALLQVDGGAAEVVALDRLAPDLVERVAQLLGVELADDVERGLATHDLSPPLAGAANRPHRSCGARRPTVCLFDAAGDIGRTSDPRAARGAAPRSGSSGRRPSRAPHRPPGRCPRARPRSPRRSPAPS